MYLKDSTASNQAQACLQHFQVLGCGGWSTVLVRFRGREVFNETKHGKTTDVSTELCSNPNRKPPNPKP